MVPLVIEFSPPPNWGPLLYIVEDVPTAPHPFLQLNLMPRDYVFDEKMANWYFAATKGWVQVPLSVEKLKEAMPPDTVSPKADRVAVWRPILRALARTRGRLIEKDGAFYIFLKPESTAKNSYLVTLDVSRRLFACDCPAYTGEGGREKKEEWKKRHVLCKHVLLSIFDLSHRLLDAAPLSPEEKSMWKKYKKAIPSAALTTKAPAGIANVEDILAANYLYYFIKNVFARMTMKPADYDESSLIVAKEVISKWS